MVDIEGMGKRIRTASALLLCALVCSACFRMRVVVKLAADGSGTQSLELAFGKAVEQRLQQAAVALAPGRDKAPDPLAVFDRRKVAKMLRDEGLSLRRHETGSTPGQRSVDMEVGFADVAGLKRSPLVGPGCEWYVLPGRTKNGLRLVIYPRGHLAWKKARVEAKELRGASSDLRQQFFKVRKPYLDGLDVDLEIQLPGRVLYTTKNLKVLEDGKGVEARLDSSRIDTASALVMALAPRYELEFEGEGIDWSSTNGIRAGSRTRKAGCASISSGTAISTGIF